MLPLSIFLYHGIIRDAFNRSELLLFQNTKIVVLILYLSTLIATWITQYENLIAVSSLLKVVVPILALIYTYSILNMKCMSERRVGDSDTEALEAQNNRNGENDYPVNVAVNRIQQR